MAGIMNFAFFCEKNSGKYIISHSYVKIYADDEETHFLAHYRLF